MTTPYQFLCEGCGWEGPDPTLDAHLHAWCPRCGKPAEFKEIALARRARRGSRDAP